MADHNKPVLTSTYANFVGELDARFDDLSLGLDPAVTSATNLPVNAIRWNSVLAKDQKWNGSSWVDKSSYYVLGSVRFNNGTAGAPSITFSDDTTTGIFKPTPTSIALTTSGVEALRTIDGNVLVGTQSNSGGRVRIKGGVLPLVFDATGAGGQLVGPEWRASDNSLRAYIKDTTESGDGGEFRIATNISQSYITLATGADVERARITSDGNLLLGTATNAGRKLDVNGNTRISGRLSVDGRIVVGGATGNDYSDGSLEILGGGPSSPGIFPTIGFHNPGVFAGSLRQNTASNFGFYTNGGVGRANLDVASLFANNQVHASDGFLTTAYVTNQRNPIWRFGDASLFGISYFHGTAGYNGTDSIGVHFGTLNGGSATGQGSHVTFNKDGVIAKRFQGVADRAKLITVIDAYDDGEPGDRGLAHITPQIEPQVLRVDFANSSVTGTGGNYAGVVTLVPYDGRAGGGPSYQLAFGSSQANGGTPQLRIRNGIDTAWNAWVDVMTPAGAILHFAMSTAPAGYLKANGAAVSRTAYQALFDAVGTTFGAGDGSTTFNLPDLRGEFIRGWDDTRGIDSGRVFGSFQTGSVESHTHAPPAGLTGPWLSNYFSGDGEIDSSNVTGPGERNAVAGNTQAYGGAETRPRNIALLACIKY